jgi:hypothetical protein
MALPERPPLLPFDLEAYLHDPEALRQRLIMAIALERPRLVRPRWPRAASRPVKPADRG